MGYYEQELERSKRQKTDRVSGAIIRRWKNVSLRQNLRGALSAFLIDPDVGFKTGGMCMAVNKIAPGSYMAAHRHGGEAIIYIVDGRGYSMIDDEKVPWEKGDMFLIGKWQWHQHFNSDPSRTATYVRVHAGESISHTMRIVLDPLPWVEFRGEANHYNDAPDLDSLIWPEDEEEEHHHI